MASINGISAKDKRKKNPGFWDPEIYVDVYYHHVRVGCYIYFSRNLCSFEPNQEAPNFDEFIHVLNNYCDGVIPYAKLLELNEAESKYKSGLKRGFKSLVKAVAITKSLDSRTFWFYSKMNNPIIEEVDVLERNIESVLRECDVLSRDFITVELYNSPDCFKINTIES